MWFDGPAWNPWNLFIVVAHEGIKGIYFARQQLQLLSDEIDLLQNTTRGGNGTCWRNEMIKYETNENNRNETNCNITYERVINNLQMFFYPMGEWKMGAWSMAYQQQHT